MSAIKVEVDLVRYGDVCISDSKRQEWESIIMAELEGLPISSASLDPLEARVFMRDILESIRFIRENRLIQIGEEILGQNENLNKLNLNTSTVYSFSMIKNDDNRYGGDRRYFGELVRYERPGRCASYFYLTPYRALFMTM